MADNILDFNEAARQGEARQDGISAEAIRERLNAAAESFIQWLFSGRALISRGHARVGDVHGTPGASLSISLTGSDVGLWHDHATAEGGDLIALYRACMGYSGNSDFVLSLKEIARDFLGDPIEVERSAWRPTPIERIEQDKVRLGTRPREDMIELGAPVASYKYFDTRGNVLASVTRYEPDGTRESKTFRPYCYRTVEGKTRWMPGAPDLRPLYRLPEISLSRSVVLVEGEGKAEALTSVGIEATSAMQGASAPIEKTDWSVLAGKTVTIWPDNDEPGAAYAGAVASKLSQLGCRVRLVPVPAGKPPKWDAGDCVAEGGDPAALIAGAVEVIAAKTTSRAFELFDVAQIKAWPPPKWMLESLVIEQSLGFIYGPPGSLKSFIALDIALSLATRQEQWWGYKIRGAGAVLYISVEGNANLPFRLKAWEQHRQINADSAPFYLIKQSVNFLKAEDVGTLLATIEVAAARAKQPIAAIFVDTVSRVLPGAKENLQEDMTIFVNACTAVREKYGSVVFGIHHANAQGSIRGSTVIPAAGDFIIETRREPGALTGSIYAKKVKDGDDGWERFFEVKRITLGDIKASTSLAVDGIDSEAPKSTADDWPDKDTLRKILAAIAEQWFRKQPWCFAKNSPRSAVVNIMRRWRITRKVVEDILAEWTANEVIVHDVCDAKSHLTGYRKLTDL